MRWPVPRMLHIRCSGVTLSHVPLKRQNFSQINRDETIVHRRKAASAAWVACGSPGVSSISRHHHTRTSSQPSGPIRLSAGKTSLMIVPDMANDPYTQLKVTGDTMLPGTAAAAVRGNLQSPPTVQHSTLLLQVNSRHLTALEVPDSSTVDSILTAASAPDLSPASCPHLYYTWAPDTPVQPQPASESSSSISSTSSMHALQQAAELLRKGEPVAIPTETVYGLAANALSASAVTAVFAAKGRPSDNPLIVHVSDLNMLAQLYPQQQQQLQEHETPQPASNGSSDSTALDSKTPPCGSSSSSLGFIPQQYHRLIAAFWPGPLTLLLPASPLIPAAVTAGLPTVAVRMPAHPVARALIAAAGVPLAAPSANTSGRPSPTTAQHVMQDLAGRIAAVVDGGACECGVESTVLDGLRNPPVVLRPGGVTAELLERCPDMHGLQVYARDFKDTQLEARPTTPGMKYRHYSPSTPLLLLDPTAAWQQHQQEQHCDQQQQQQQQHNSLQQLVVHATQQLLQDLWQEQQQQQQVHSQPPPQQQRVVLLSTCHAADNADRNPGVVGWTPASLQALQQQPPMCHQQVVDSADAAPPGHGPTQHPADINSSASVENGTSTVNNSSSSSSSGGNRGGEDARSYSNGGCSGSCGVNISPGFEVLEYVLGSWQQPELVAKQVFAALRAADAVQPTFIIAQGLPPEGAALAVMNRLHKAASRHIQVAALSS